MDCTSPRPASAGAARRGDLLGLSRPCGLVWHGLRQPAAGSRPQTYRRRRNAIGAAGYFPAPSALPRDPIQDRLHYCARSLRLRFAKWLPRDARIRVYDSMAVSYYPDSAASAGVDMKSSSMYRRSSWAHCDVPRRSSRFDMFQPRP